MQQLIEAVRDLKRRHPEVELDGAGSYSRADATAWLVDIGFLPDEVEGCMDATDRDGRISVGDFAMSLGLLAQLTPRGKNPSEPKPPDAGSSTSDGEEGAGRARR